MKRTLAITMLVLIGAAISQETATLKDSAMASRRNTSKMAYATPLQKPTKDTIPAADADSIQSAPLKKEKAKVSAHHKATWYKTIGTRVHKEHPEIHGTAAYNFLPKGTRLKVTNVENGKYCIVEVTDRMGSNSKNKIDLSHAAFGLLESHARGAIKVTIEIHDEKQDTSPEKSQG